MAAESKVTLSPLELNAKVAAFALSPRVIAIDGPAGSGKSTVGAAVAGVLDFLFFDTGVMYRAVTWVALARGIDPSDEAQVGTLARRLTLDVLPPAMPADGVPALGDNHANRVLADGEDVSGSIRRGEVEQSVSLVSAYAEVRQALSAHQRNIGARYGAGRAERAGIVMVGRDIGTVIMPDAPLKVYLDASAEVRARRRYDELRAKGSDVAFDTVLAELRRRDEIDSGRSLSPLRAAPDAVVLDTSTLTVAEVVVLVLRLVIARGSNVA